MHDVVSRLGELQDSQMECTLLRSCLALPKVSYILRTCPPPPPPFINNDVLECFNDLMQQTLSDIAGCPVSNWAWLKASLPTSLGGLGLRRTSLNAPAAYISLFHQAGPLISNILGHDPVTPPSLLPSVIALAHAASNPDCCLLEDINIPLR